MGYRELPTDIQGYVPNYEYLLYDISEYTDEEIKGVAQLRILLTIFRDIFTKDREGLRKSISRSVSYLQELEDKQTGVEYLETLLRYIFSAGRDFTKQDIHEIIQQIETTYPEGSEIAMTLAERYREEGMKEGMKKGLVRGQAEGETKALTKTAIQLLTKKFGKIPEDLQRDIANLDAATLEVVIGDILEYETLEDVKKYLR